MVKPWMHMNYRKKILIFCLVVIIFVLFSLLLGFNIELFCSDSYQCFEKIKEGFVIPLIYLSPFLLISLIILFFVSDRLKKVGLISIVIILIPILFIIFISSLDNSYFLPDGRASNTLLLMFIYLIIFIISLSISAIYFKIKDKN